MGEEESKVTKVVREGVVKAYEKGENLIIAVSEITRGVVKKTLAETQPTKEKVESLARDAMKGAIQWSLGDL